MSLTPLETSRLKLVPQSRDEVKAYVAEMPPEEKAQLSAFWLAMLDSSGAADPWIHGYRLMHRESGAVLGKCGFKGPPDAEGVVEIAYGVDPEHKGRGYATEAAQALVQFAFGHAQVRVVRAHTLPSENASTRVLTKCGFRRVGEVIDAEDGLVWRWESERPPESSATKGNHGARGEHGGRPGRDR